MARHLHFATFALLLLPCAAGLAAQAEVLATLAPNEQMVKQGTAPRFVVKIRAGSGPLRVMKFAQRNDLRHAYARVTVTHGGQPVSVARVISDPGPTAEGDYVVLPAGQEVTFAHDGMPFLLSRLPLGTYEATVKLRPDWRSAAVFSNSVTFQVVP